ncbi:hypothetical protein [Micromonospora sp. U21]|uniref:hypothetical protein n=1 Tax=Micromonospora sp. U21 TaxID=2824899 RepID=UPI001B36F219|nr:hypothetical protein [Micromonospora sp. U21]MBQ0904337.1 hypothetical protein [Micromonospora sp. U21]
MAAAAFVLAPAAAAQAADVGDGSLDCNSGEICFSQHEWHEGGRKHFWYNAIHTDLDFHTGYPLMDEASWVWVRDTRCGIYLYDYRTGFDHSLWLPTGGGSQALSQRSASHTSSGTWNDVNNEHKRCSSQL